MALDPALFREIMSNWVSGVTVITTTHDQQPIGMTASSFNSLSISPLLVSVFIGKKVSTHDVFAQSGFFAINILGANQIDIGKRFAGMMPHITDRFADLPFETATTGAPVLQSAVAWLDCKTYATLDGGDHTIFIGEVVNANLNPDRAGTLLYGHRKWGGFKPTLSPQAITHVVMFRLKENTAEMFEKLKTALDSLPAQIPQIKHLEVGHNVVPSDRAYDVALTVIFDSLDDLNTYQVHPAHQAVVNEIIKPNISASVAIDYHP